MQYFSFIVTENDAGQRLDAYLASLLPFSRSYISSVIKKGRALVDGVVVKPSYRLAEEELVELYVEPPPEPLLKPSSIPLDILFEDEVLIVINKPAGISVHPGAGQEDDTLISAVIAHTEIRCLSGWPLRPGVVHRLDKDTSGLMVVAKSEVAYQSLVRQFSRRQVFKQYQAVCHGILPQDEGIIEAPIGRHRRHRQMMAVRPSTGKPAATVYRVERFFPPQATLFLALPRTGRTHQIRVHLAHIGYPLMGDRVYGGRVGLIGRQALHAQLLSFEHPIEERKLEFSAPLPEDMQELINHLSGGR